MSPRGIVAKVPSLADRRCDPWTVGQQRQERRSVGTWLLAVVENGHHVTKNLLSFGTPVL